MFKITLALCSIGLFMVAVRAKTILTGADHEAWNAFKSEHGKQYDTLGEELMRRNLFIQRKQSIEEWNAKYSQQYGYERGVNHMSDWTDEERELMTGLQLPDNLFQFSEQNNLTVSTYRSNIVGGLPEEVDLRKDGGIVTSVKDQGKCGSSWVYAWLGALEGQERYHMQGFKDKGLVSLSAQQLIDCEPETYGCKVKKPRSAFFYSAIQGVQDEASYPYKGVDGVCNYNKDKVVVKNKSTLLYIYMTVHGMQDLIANYGPVFTGMSSKDLLDYKSGIIKDKCSSDYKSLDHGVLLMGYGSENGTDYWIAKNSWGEDWGEKGYVRIARDNRNLCGLLLVPLAPVF